MKDDVSERGGEFLKVTFDGGRFAKHSVPVTVLAELTTLQQLVLRVARHLYFQHHGERKRVPQGFTEASQLHLRASVPNCFTAELLRPDEFKMVGGGRRTEQSGILSMARCRRWVFVA